MIFFGNLCLFSNNSLFAIVMYDASIQMIFLFRYRYSIAIHIFFEFILFWLFFVVFQYFHSFVKFRYFVVIFFFYNFRIFSAFYLDLCKVPDHPIVLSFVSDRTCATKVGRYIDQAIVQGIPASVIILPQNMTFFL